MIYQLKTFNPSNNAFFNIFDIVGISAWCLAVSVAIMLLMLLFTWRRYSPFKFFVFHFIVTSILTCLFFGCFCIPFANSHPPLTYWALTDWHSNDSAYVYLAISIIPANLISLVLYFVYILKVINKT